MALRFISQTVTTRPLTRSQQLIWTGQRLQPDDPLYNMAMAFELHGEIDSERFVRAFQTVIDASDAMRTTFEHHAGVARQRFHEQYLYDVECLDMRRQPAEQVDAWLAQRTRHIFDLERCLFDSALLQLDTDRYIWYFNQHHLVTDASSTALIYRAMANAYSRERDTDSCPLTLPPFSAYVDHEQARQTSKANQRARQYWQTRPALPIDSLSFYAERPGAVNGVTRRIPCELGVERIERFKALAASSHCQALTSDLAQFQVMATTLFAWLYRVSGNRTLALSMPTHNRGSDTQKKTPGLFIELYPLIVEIEDDETFLSLYRKVAASTQNVLIHTAPGASSFALNRDVQVVLNYITAEFGPFGAIPMTSRWIHPDSGDRNHLVRMQVENFDGIDNLRLFFDVNEQAFPGAQQTRPGQDFCRLMDAFTQQPQQRIIDAPLLTSEHLEALGVDNPQPERAADRPATVIDAFCQRVNSVPQSVAVREGAQTLTYRELNRSAQAFAQKLAAMGVEPHDRVAIMLPRSLDAIVAILGTLMRGAAYVPIDDTHPLSRRQFVLRDAAVRAVVCAVSQADDVKDEQAVITAPFELGDTINHESSVSPAHTAYLIYTSGSTGTPKGVEVGHDNLAHYIGWAAGYYQPERPLCWPLFSSLAFDLTITSLFVPLVSGGELVIYRDDAVSGMLIRDVVEANEVDVIKLTPAHLALLQAMDLSTSRLQSLIVGGEDFRTELARSVHNYFGGRVKLFNEYGPTEGTVACAVHEYEPQTDTLVSVPIGHAIHGTYLYVLDEAGRHQVPGAIGELCIGGPGVARGYFRRDALTAERFIADPYRAGERLYRTGDLARFRLDDKAQLGALQCLGRIDHQIKLNGFRIEPGEIEQAMLKLPSITEATVMLHVPETVEHDEEFCVRCGISNRHPAAQLDDEQVCKICRIYEAEAQRARDYFRTLDDLAEIVDTIVASRASREPGAADCMMLLSGGKDSTFALCQVVDLGLKPLVFTLDNGFISQGAKDNMKRVTDHLGLELIEGTTPAMNAIFRDSLNRFSNVCNGCFKTIYTLSLKIARDRGIRHIFTGLSRGQIFETRVADLFRQGEFDIDRIDSMIIDARRAYHRADDAVSQLMDVSHFDDDSVFTDIEYVDYYRYTDVELSEMLVYLDERVPWVRPADTGRSTNCLINEAGIFVHKQERGFHNYSLPYSWDVRLGHKERDAAREELDDNINIDNVNRILNEIEYTPRTSSERRERAQLVAYYVESSPLDSHALRTALADVLPDALVPTAYVPLQAMPLTPNGKVDRAALPTPSASRAHLDVRYEAPEGQVEKTLATVWREVFGIDRIGVNDNFFELGGDSIVNIQIVASVAKHGLLLSPQQVFDRPTIRALAQVVDSTTELASEQGPIEGSVPLAPAQQRYFGWGLARPERYCQYVVLHCEETLDTHILREALRQLVVHHDVLRAQFHQEEGNWTQTFANADEASVNVQTLAEHDVDTQWVERHIGAFQQRCELKSGQLFHAVLAPGPSSSLLLIAHHLIIDAVSWWVLMDDLEQVYTALKRAEPVQLPPKTTSMRHWAAAQQTFGASTAARDELSGWQRAVRQVNALPEDTGEHVARSMRLSLDSKTSRQLLSDVSAAWRIQPQDVLIAALADTVFAWSGLSHFTLDVEAHGREPITPEVDTLRTVGWFTSVYPVTLAADEATEEAGMLPSVRDRLRRVTLGGSSYGALRFGADKATAAALSPAVAVPVLFNYLGVWRQPRSGGLLTFARPLAASFGEDNTRPYAWEINAMFYDGQLHIDWAYQGAYREDTLHALGAALRQRVTTLVEYILSHDDTLADTSDFQSAGVDQGDLDDILAEYGDL